MTDEPEDDVPAGWYPDARDMLRWWDGEDWTDHVQGSAGDPEVTAVLAPVRSDARTRHSAEDADDEPDHRRRTWLVATFVGLLAFFLGMGIGGRGTPEPTEPVNTEVTTSSGATAEELDRREAELKTREDDVASKQSDLDQREQDVARRESDIQDAPSGTGTGTIENGVFEVGSDIQPGQYASAGPEDTDLPCSYRVSSDEEGDEIITSEIVDGPGNVVLAEGQFFTSEYCQTWQLQ